MLDFCLEPKKWEIQKFFEIGPRLDTAPRGFFESGSLKSNNTHKNGIVSARYVMLVLIFIVFQRGRQWRSLI